MLKTKVILIPGNGGGTPKDNWFPTPQISLEKHKIKVIASDFPDNDLARSKYWLPFLKDKLKADNNTILVGHSSGAVAAMRFAEQYKILGSVLVGACCTDLGIDTEKQSGYYDKPWQWQKIKSNQKWISLFTSQNDPWIPVAEPRHIHDNLNCEYHEFKTGGHFGGDYYKPDFPEVTSVILGSVHYR